MAEASIPVDVFNPGQVLACMGFLEAADHLMGDAEGRFDWSTAHARFVLRSGRSSSPIAAVLDFVAAADVKAVAPWGTGLKDGYQVETVGAPPGLAPCAIDNLKESSLPVILSSEVSTRLWLSHWSDSATGRDAFKLWGGAGGYSGAARTRDLQSAFKVLWYGDRQAVLAAPFDAAAELSSGFRLEMRRDYVPLDIGFSVNAHRSTGMVVVGYPVAELLAAIGLEHARPRRGSRLSYRYGVWSRFLPPNLARPIIGAARMGFGERFFRMTLGEPNDYDRSILLSREENLP